MRVRELCMLVLSTTVLVFPGHAQGHIYGVITDSASGKLLVGANLFLLGTVYAQGRAIAWIRHRRWRSFGGRRLSSLHRRWARLQPLTGL